MMQIPSNPQGSARMKKTIGLLRRSQTDLKRYALSVDHALSQLDFS